MPDFPDTEVVALDTETSGLHPDDGARVASLAIAWEGGSMGLPFDQGIRDKLPTEQLDLLGGDEDPNLGEGEWRETLEWLGGKKLVFHNAKFDLTMMRAGTRHWSGADLGDAFRWDTLLGAAVLQPTLSKSLDAASKRAGLGGKEGLDAIKAWLKQHKFKPNRYDLAPWHIVEPYVAADAELTYELYRWQRRMYKGQPLPQKFLRRELELCRTLFRMEGRGVLLDVDTSLEAAERLLARADEIEGKMPFKCTTPGAKGWFCEQLGLDTDRKTDKGAPSIDEEQVRRWAAQGVEWAKEYAEVSRMRRAVSMWYQGYPDKLGADGRLRTVYKQAHVKSGRMSVERVQLQALPHEDKLRDGMPSVRGLLQAKEGYGLWSLDLSQAELRVASKYARCERMLELLADDADVHGVTAMNLFDDAEPDGSPQWKHYRTIAKRLNFAAIFQVGPDKFQATISKMAGIQLPLEECREYVYGWRGLYPEFERMFKKAMRMAESRGWVPVLPNTEWEEKSQFGERDYPNTAWNRIVQGSLAAFFKQWMIEVERDYPGRMLLTIHDSVLLELPLSEGDGIAAEVAARGAEMATDLFGLEMPVDQERW